MNAQDPGAPVILIAERDPSVRELQTHFLERAGYVVEFVSDGQAALASALLTPPALVVAEILLPKLDGLALCRALREEPRTSRIPVLIFSILAAAARAGEAGANAYLRKPLVEQTFVAAVQELIAAHPTAARGTIWVSN